MRLKFGNKSLEYSQAEYPKTRVLLINDEGAMYPIYFDREAIDKSDAELFELALEKIYQDNFPNRAEDERFNTIGEKIAEIDQVIERAKEQQVQVEEMMKMTTAMVNELIESANLIRGGTTMTINYFAMQVQLGLITLEQVPKLYREKVRELLELSEIGTKKKKLKRAAN